MTEAYHGMFFGEPLLLLLIFRVLGGIRVRLFAVIFRIWVWRVAIWVIWVWSWLVGVLVFFLVIISFMADDCLSSEFIVKVIFL